MGHMALLLRDCGHVVSGSDEGVYSPMREMLDESGIAYATRYDPTNIGSPDAVIVGNAIGRGNVELEAVLDRRIPFRSQAEVLREAVLERRRPAVVAGTHGKTTCTAMLAWLLQSLDPGFLIGGIPQGARAGAKLGGGDPFVVEGDEYDTAFFDKGPKFLHYRPWLVLLNSIEFDHADIYSDLSSYLVSFERLVNVVPSSGRLILNTDGEGVERVRARARCPVKTFGRADDDHTPKEIRSENGGFRSFSVSGIEGRFETSLIGRHNIINATGCMLAALEFGIPLDEIRHQLRGFRGVRRRQELVLDGSSGKGVLLYDDFAHHPTAILETLRAFRETFPSRRIWAVFEPRSWSMRKSVFQDALPPSFAPADRVVIGPVFRRELVKDSLDPAGVAASISAGGRPAEYVERVDDIVSLVLSESQRADVIVVLSNGSFGGLVGKLTDALGAFTGTPGEAHL